MLGIAKRKKEKKKKATRRCLVWKPILISESKLVTEAHYKMQVVCGYTRLFMKQAYLSISVKFACFDTWSKLGMEIKNKTQRGAKYKGVKVKPNCHRLYLVSISLWLLSELNILGDTAFDTDVSHLRCACGVQENRPIFSQNSRRRVPSERVFRSIRFWLDLALNICTSKTL